MGFVLSAAICELIQKYSQEVQVLGLLESEIFKGDIRPNLCVCLFVCLCVCVCPLFNPGKNKKERKKN